MSTESQAIARTIAEQIGHRALTMIGAKDLVSIENGLQFGIGRNAKRISKIVIKLDLVTDTYTVCWWRGRGVRMELEKESPMVYGDGLRQAIEINTGMATSL